MKTYNSIKETARRRKINFSHLLYNEIINFICDLYEFTIEEKRLQDLNDNLVSLFDDDDEQMFDENASLKEMSYQICNYMYDISHDLLDDHCNDVIKDTMMNWFYSLDDKQVTEMYMDGTLYELLDNIDIMVLNMNHICPKTITDNEKIANFFKQGIA